MALDGEGVDRVAVVALDRRDEVGADALRNEVGGERRLRIHGPGAAVGAHRDAAHGLDTAGQDEVFPPGLDSCGRLVDGLEARGAEAVQLHAGNLLPEAGGDDRGARDVGALVADRCDTAEDDVVDDVGVEVVVPLAHLLEEPGHE